MPVFPPPDALAVAQDRLPEKTFFRAARHSDGARSPPSRAWTAWKRPLVQVGLPAVLKTRRLGYDGKGQRVVANAAEARARVGRARPGTAASSRASCRFRRELSILAVRDRGGAMASYPLVENVHRDGILRRSLAPAPDVSPALAAEAERLVERLLAHLDYVGVLAIELFDTDGGLLANEMAPRVHNSGHWTIEGAETSQFENHVRAVTGAPLGSVESVGVSAMLNLIGRWPEPSGILAIPGAHLHLYGKAPRRGRKVGHVTLRVDDASVLAVRLAALEPLVADSADG